MEITFGWGLDGAAWEKPGHGSDSGAALGHAAVGPAGLAGILGTRLGIGGVTLERPLRIGAYRDALAQTPRQWCGASFELDAWAVAKKMLSWRDELVAAGWDGSPVAGASPRLADLADAEALFDAPGAADDFRDVAAMLRSLVAGGVEWPLGIDRLTILGSRDGLPAPWPQVIADVEALGVDVAEEDAPAAVERLRVISAATEWEAAEAAARILATSGGTLVATHHTEVLDQELSRRGMARLGALETSDQRATAQILPMFLAAICGPIDVHAIAAFLDMGLTTTDTRTGEVIDLGVVPSVIRRGLLGALAAQPGVGGPAWLGALETIRADIAARADEVEGVDKAVAANRATVHGELLDTLDSYLRTSRIEFADGQCGTAAIIERLEWLAQRLRNMGAVFDAPELLVAGRSVSTAIEVLGRQDVVGERELQRILEDCGSAQASPLAGAEAAEGTRVPSPALIRHPGPVVWWGAVDDGRSERRIWTPEEVRILAAAGVEVPDPGTLATLSATADVAGLCRAGDVIAIVPTVIDGAATTRHPALSFAAHGSAGYDEDDSEFTARELVADGTWAFGDASLPLDVPEPFVPDADAIAANATARSVPPGTHLLPDRLSYSQMEKLLVHRLEWLLAYPLRIRQGWVTDIPTGNRMIGTFLHAIVEKIVEDDLDGADAGTVRTCFAELLPHYASELNLPGNARLRQQVEAEALESIPELFGSLRRGGMVVTAAEAPITKELVLTLRDPDGDPGGNSGDAANVHEHPVTLVGFRDLDAETSDGTTVVIDMKYSVSRHKYGRLIESGRSLQLATYAWSVAEELPLESIVTAYFELKYGRFDSLDPALGGMAPANGAIDPETLWRRAVTSVEDALSEIMFAGVVRDEGNAMLVAAGGVEREITKRSANASEAADMNDRYLPMDTAKYVDYGIITGIEADPS
ncbi:PD-(D/E)XK nuclease family protein [Corynebacterium sp. NPDC060344]|uniref:PD-(D/E)XK nuclease family protein n=1 Tax=Corynebacterium sp. NPDC060344 TaxID=3347101 RepID=UPI00364675A9